ncbi:hypothetical protein NKJ73_30205 [Mesorhizobium sp. M0074]
MKIGSALIGDPETGEVRGPWLETLIEDVVRFFARGQQVIIVTSGAVAVGSSHFNHLDRSLRVEEKQTADAIGQVQLMRAYEQSLKRHSFGVWSTLQRLLKVGAVPIINENDTTATAVGPTRTCRRRAKSRCMEGCLCRDFLTALLRARLTDGSADPSICGCGWRACFRGFGSKSSSHINGRLTP